MLLTQTKRSTAPLEAALDAMLSHIESFAPHDESLALHPRPPDSLAQPPGGHRDHA